MSIQNWCDTWLLNLNASKCSCLHFSHGNARFQYKIRCTSIPSERSTVDLGVDITDYLKFSSHCRIVAARSQRMLSTFRLAFKSLNLRAWCTLYKAFVRSILEYCSVVWSPQYVKDIEILEKVQRRFTRILPDFRHLPYEDRLRLYGIPSLFARRLSFDLIFVYKCIHRR